MTKVLTSSVAGPGAAPAPAAFERANELVEPALCRALGRLAPAMARIARYHMGWAEADGSEAAAGTGKGLRPTLAVLSAEAAGAAPEIGIPGAVAVELVHNFSLVHDDVVDGDTKRRHRPTVWTVFGVGNAIIAGDALLALAHQVLLDVPGEPGQAAARLLAQATSEMIRGQADDMAFERNLDVTLAACGAMEAAKTGAIIACAASIGALLAGASAPVPAALHEMGMHLGLSFQAVDDVLGIWGDPGVTGKPAGNDLRQHKQSLPVVAALCLSGDAERHELRSILGRDELSDGDVARASALIEDCGGRRLAMAEASKHLSLALSALQRSGAAPGPAGELGELARFVVERQR